MDNMKKLLFVRQTALIILLICCINNMTANCQQTPSSMNIQVVPQPPDVASLFSFVETPVSYFNGSAKINIPLYEIKSGDLSFPITINYQSSGIKVDEEASSVGLGWSITTTACMSETNPLGTNTNGVGVTTYALAPDNYAYPPEQVPDDAINMVESGEVFKNTTGACDTLGGTLWNFAMPGNEPDMFILSANGVSGKFFIPNSMTGWVEVGASNIKLTGTPLSYIAGENASTQGLTATLPDGTQYLFKDFTTAVIPQFSPIFYSLRPSDDLSAVVTSLSGDGYVSSSPYYSHTYYLTQITSPLGKTIHFKYLNKNNLPRTEYQPSCNETAGYSYSTADVPYDMNGHNFHVMSSGSTQNIYLDSILFENGFCTFSYSGRQDLNGYKLDEIKVYARNSSLQGVSIIRDINFLYDYYDGPKGQYGDYRVDPPVGFTAVNDTANESYRRLRLKLTEVQINNEPPYILNYDSTPLPYKTAYAKDIWGFFNGSAVHSMLPDYSNLGYLNTDFVPIEFRENITGTGYGHRTANETYAKAGMLTSIKYPTGGYTDFNFELNNILDEGTAYLSDTLVNVIDTGSGAQAQVFTVPVIPSTANPSHIHIFLTCSSYDASTDSGMCSGYGTPNTAQTNPTNGLYGYLQKQNTDGSWAFLEVFDASNNLRQNGQLLLCDSTMSLSAGNYKMVVNYPDDKSDGHPNIYYAQMSVSYSVWKSANNYTAPSGGGLRIKKITSYDVNDNEVSQKNFTYKGGKLMTRPIFFRYMNQSAFFAMYSPACSVLNPSLMVSTGTQANYADPIYSFGILYNNAVVPYSYSANGSLIGYDTVIEQRVNTLTEDNGRVIYTYNAKPDRYYFYGTNLPGVPSTPYLDNGTLLTQITQKRTGTNTYTTVDSISYKYNITDSRIFWAYKWENLCYLSWPIYGNNKTDPNLINLHFYPIKTGHVNLTKKTECEISSTGTMQTTTTDYTYNYYNQVDTILTTLSNGKTYMSSSFFPGDYTANDFTAEMRSRNMLDYPIEKIERIDGVGISGQYFKYLLHDNIVTASESYLLRTLGTVSITPSVPSGSKSSRYKLDMSYAYDASGNLVTQQKGSGLTTVYLWGYNNSYPVAKIVGSDYSTVLSLVDINKLSTGTESEVEAELSTLRSAFAGNKNVQVTTFTYRPLFGVSSQVAPNGTATYYNYDAYGRLLNISDKDTHTLKGYQYHYQGQ